MSYLPHAAPAPAPVRARALEMDNGLDSAGAYAHRVFLIRVFQRASPYLTLTRAHTHPRTYSPAHAVAATVAALYDHGASPH
jgi:hypothetical protein